MWVKNRSRVTISLSVPEQKVTSVDFEVYFLSVKKVYIIHYVYETGVSISIFVPPSTESC